jgi:hypothetical protein
MVKPKFSVVFDSGKPFEEFYNSLEELEGAIKSFYESLRDEDFQYDISVFDAEGEDITGTQLIGELLNRVLG